MASALPLILAAGAAAVILGGKKKRTGGTSDVPLDRPIQVKKDGLVVNSGRSPVPPAVEEDPLAPFNGVQQVQESLIAAGKGLEHGADGKWGPESQGALDSYNAKKGFVNEAKAHLATPDTLRALHSDAEAATKRGGLASVQTSVGTMLWCDISKMSCKSDHECVPLWGEGAAPSGYEDLGICIPSSMIQAGYIPGPDAYAPGGFNRIVFSPDYNELTIGGGWRFQTLEPWLYKRMKAGKLLTYALEGGLFWEDLISTSPGKFWNSTLASIGLATASGAVGAKGWLDFKKSFKTRVPEGYWQDAWEYVPDYSQPIEELYDRELGSNVLHQPSKYVKKGREFKQFGTKLVPRSATMGEKAIAIGVPIIYAAVVVGMVWGGSALARKLGEKQRDLIAESAILAWKDFAKSHVVRVGDRKVRIIDLPENYATQAFQAYVATQVTRFQMSNYE
jgi:hypothetical protein